MTVNRYRVDINDIKSVLFIYFARCEKTTYKLKIISMCVAAATCGF
jgi:hypothetical protein